jgi:uncharacterized membrane protein YagU involved in acid resistance
MKRSLARIFVAGVGATVVITVTTMVVYWAGGPRMNEAELLSYLFGLPMPVTWVLHFGVGITFAILYSLLIEAWLKKLHSWFARGAAFGVIAFVLAQVSFILIGAVTGRTPPVVGSLPVMAAVAFFAHVIFGIALVGMLGVQGERTASD